MIIITILSDLCLICWYLLLIIYIEWNIHCIIISLWPWLNLMLNRQLIFCAFDNGSVKSLDYPGFLFGLGLCTWCYGCSGISKWSGVSRGVRGHPFNNLSYCDEWAFCTSKPECGDIINECWLHINVWLPLKRDQHLNYENINERMGG